MTRCAWVPPADPLYVAYHDEEWGVPSHDQRHLFELLVLEGAQAGLSWSTILRKREGYRRAFAGFDVERVAAFGPRDVERLLGDAGIVRNRAKIEAAIQNANAFLATQKEFGSFCVYAWKFTDPTVMSKDLRRRGFRFVGPTIVESFMEATGILDHHERTCDWRHRIRTSRSSRRV